VQGSGGDLGLCFEWTTLSLLHLIPRRWTARKRQSDAVMTESWAELSCEKEERPAAWLCLLTLHGFLAGHCRRQLPHPASDAHDTCMD
jgi:hypothetical protein